MARLATLLLVLVAAHAAHAAGDFTFHAASFRLGSLALRDVTLAIHDRGNTTTTCVSARIADARIHACGAIETVHGELVVHRGHVDLVIPRRSWDGATLAETAVSADVSGNLSKLELELRGTANTSQLELHGGIATATLHDLKLPFAVHAKLSAGAVEVREATPLVVEVGRAQVSGAGAKLPITPVITVHPGWPKWSTDVAWAGVELGPALAAASGGRIAGSGLLAGELVFHGDRTDVSLARGEALAPSGKLRLTDAALRDRLAAAVQGNFFFHERVAATLSDFSYSHLALVFGANPDVKITLVGRGQKISQDLDLVVNVRSQP